MVGGGGIRITEEVTSVTSISNCLFYLPDGGYSIIPSDSCQITNNIFMGDGFMIRLSYQMNQDGAPPDIRNNLFYNNRENADLIPSGDVDIEEFGVLDRVNSNGDSTDIFGNLFMDPELVMEGDFPENYFPTDDSPCIDAGNPEADLDPDSTIADIGPFFFPQCNIRVNRDEIEFIDVQTGTRVETELEIRNIGLQPLEITDMSIIPEDAPFGVDFDEFPDEILPDSSCTIWIVFIPRHEDTYEAVLQIESNDRDEGILEIPITGSALGINSDNRPLPGNYVLYNAYPNPFNNLTRIEFGLPEASRLTVSVYDVSGRSIACLVEGKLSAGHHTAVWNASKASTGVYLVRLETDGFNAVRKVILVK